MTQAPSQALLKELEALLGPRGFTRDAGDMAPWLTDWRGAYSGRAAAMLSPASAEETRAAVGLCAAAGAALVPQGGNTSMVGGATPSSDGSSLLLSTRRMQAIRSLSAGDNSLVAEAGAILSNVHAEAEKIGCRFPLSLGAKGSATVGGLVSTNAGGTQVVRFGPMRSLVLGLEAVLPDGSMFHGLSTLRKDNRGYDLKQLLIGAEGTLGVVTAASLRLVPAAGSRAVAWVGVSSPASALALLRRLESRLGDAVESFELVPDQALSVVLRHIPGTRPPLAGSHPWHVLVEAVLPPGGPDAPDLLSAAIGEVLQPGLAEDALVAASEAQAQSLWRLRDSIAEAERQEGPSIKHDISVPVAVMPAFIESARQGVLSRFPGSKVIAFGHLGDGNVHFNVQSPVEADARAWQSLHGAEVSAFIYDMVTEAGGSISAEHGIGQMKIGELMRTADPARLVAQRLIKQGLDPRGIMNPGKLFPAA